MSNLTSLLGDFVQQITSLSPELLTVAAVIVVGYVLRFIPAVPNKLIPAACCVTSAVTYPLIADRASISFDVRLPVVRQILVGIVLWLVAWVMHDKVLRRFEAWLPKDFFPNSTPPSPPPPTTTNV